MAQPNPTEAAPAKATSAVLKPSEFSTADATEVTGIDFNKYADRNITVAELVDNMSTMGFQATSVGEAVKLVEKMVSFSDFSLYLVTGGRVKGGVWGSLGVVAIEQTFLRWIRF